MRRNFCAMVLTMAFCACQAQPIRNEFEGNPNGLMYSDADMSTLRVIVDSLNLRFKTCDFSKIFYSQPQARFILVNFKSEKDEMRDLRSDLESNMPYETLIEKYKLFIDDIDSGQLMIKIAGKEKTYYLDGNPSTGYDSYYPPDDSPVVIDPGTWKFSYSKKDKYFKNHSVYARYFLTGWQNRSLPKDYARLIQYVDCMIDTSAKIFLTEKYKYRGATDKDEYRNLQRIILFLNAELKTKDNTDAASLSEAHMQHINACLLDKTEFRNLVVEAINDYVEHDESHFQLEQIANDMGMFDKALLLKRYRRVMGFCSRDDSPRRHARDIAITAARAHSWDIFLRAHLDIMNDRFERMSDGSYAWGDRKTYLRELEELNLNIVDLMLGLSLRASNTSPNHYHGTLWRLGWALSESREQARFEEMALNMMKDEQLDEFNRGLIFLLYQTYIKHLENTKALTKINGLRNTINEYPDFIRRSIAQLEDPKNEDDE